ncbi:MAG: hypothetical protein HYX99_03145 [Chloroflexi bacterium]|nr:hypothetical protein [Chloroflexota bacterium]
MALRITEACTTCHACEWACDVDHAITMHQAGKFATMMMMSAEACKACGLCRWQDNVDVSTGMLEDLSTRGRYYIDPDKCTECVGSYGSPRCLEVCPEEAIVKDPHHAETREQLLAKWHRLHPEREPVAGTY